MNFRKPNFATLTLVALLHSATGAASAQEGADDPAPTSIVDSSAASVHAIVVEAADSPTGASGATPGLLPYQAAAHTTTDRVRFLLALPGRPLLVECRISIDGQPYQAARGRRIDELLADKGPEKKAPPNMPLADKAPEMLLPPVETTPLVTTVDQSPQAKLARYIDATGRQPARDEVAWLMSQWLGPTLSIVNRNFERIRRHQAPALETLDRDNDGQLSPKEIARLRESMLIADRNQDELATYTEVGEAAEAKQRTRSATDVRSPWDPPTPLLLLGSGELAAHQSSVWLQRLLAHYDAAGESFKLSDSKPIDVNGDQQISPPEYQDLLKQTADLELAVDFNTAEVKASKLTVLKSPAKMTQSSTDRLVLRLDGADVTIQIATTESTQADQISVGAVIDGFPLLPHLDFNNDGRITLREMNRAPQHLATLDRNGDHSLTADETPGTVRLVIGRGLVAHRVLATLPRVHRAATAGTAAETVTPPGWFIRNDRNRDGDISPKEFLGNDEQFTALDADGDGLISGAEAAASEQVKKKQ